MSPPCVAYYDPSADNGGATAPGVTPDEVRVVVYLDYGYYAKEQPPPPDAVAPSVVDLDEVKPPCPESYPLGNPGAAGCDSAPVRAARALIGFHNARYQTYNRRVHGYAVFTDAATQARRRSDAAFLVERIDPFAVLDETTFRGYAGAFADELASLGVVVVSRKPVLRAEAAEDAPYRWSFWPDADVLAESFAGFVCAKVAGRPVAHSGLPGGLLGFNGMSRTFGIYRSTDPSHPELTALGDAALAAIDARCDLGSWVQASYRLAGYSVDNSDPGSDALDAVATFRQSGVTTVLMVGGQESRFSHVAAATGYFPEIVLLGDLELDNASHAQLQDPLVWRNAWGPTPDIRRDRPADGDGARAYREASPQGPSKDLVYAEEYYRDVMLLFTGIQTAGAPITASLVETGLRSLPARDSTGPYVAASSYPDGEFSGVDDAMQIWWDPAAQVEGRSLPGCYRMVAGGLRFRAATWTTVDDAFASPSDPCTANHGPTAIRPA